MKNITFITRCPGCGASNRVRLMSGKRVRARCGCCGEPLPVNMKRVFVLAAWQGTKDIFTEQLPKTLILLVDAALGVMGAIFAPLRSGWRRLAPGTRKRTGWVVIAVLALCYVVLEDTIRLSSILALAVLLAVAAVVLLASVRGPQALSQLGARVIRRCPACGHRHFGWLKSCPRCGGQPPAA